ncbi:DNA-directed RNA polymerase II subunit RPB1 [Cephus cinctus]|uniref:DNA-directed RNA polymerase II subunit RPB1 n=1 Tax=Cephus cinctus TaxID=211228 RepID=A0AAJ7C5I7_CEPCN|nr:DNA-directed RNA polymerase II subunit RPB1 [Cephus cinctus]
MLRKASMYLLVVGLASSATLPETVSYTKISRNGEEPIKASNGPMSWVMSLLKPKNGTTSTDNEGRSGQDISITVSPVYVPPKTPQLHNGEAVDYPSTKKYSTLDLEMVAKMNSLSGKTRAQERFHPPAIFEHDVAHSNSLKHQADSSDSSDSSSSSSSSYSDSSDNSGPPNFDNTPVFPGSYDYKPPDYFAMKPMSNPPPSSIDSYAPPSDTIPKIPDSYGPSLGSYTPDSHGPPDYHDHHPDDPEFTQQVHSSNFGSRPIYGGELPPKPIEYAGHFDHPSFVDDPYIHDHDHDYHHDIIYDHIPEDHTTMKPEMMDQRLNRRPYSYYFIGKKLWYIPLYFSIYFIIYIAALVLKSVTRHKINFPANFAAAAAAAHAGRSVKDSDSHSWWDLSGKILEGIESAAKKYERTS